MQLNFIIIFGLFTLIFSCKEEKLEPPLDKIFLCAMDEMINDINFQEEWLTIGANYFSWVPDGYMQYDSIDIGNGNAAWSELEDVNIDVGALISVLNTKFPKGHKLIQIPKGENEKKLRFEKKEQFCSWYFGGIKRNRNKYFFKGGFARSSRVGSGALFIIEIDDKGLCGILGYDPTIF